MTSAAANSTVSPEEMDKFRAMAESWWDPNGKFKPLHRFNPVRIAYIREKVATHFDRNRDALAPFQGLSLLDIGCGGGLLAEPMARLGFAVTAIDALERNVQVARTHAEGQNLNIDYRHATTEDLVAEGKIFDVVLNMEVVEHVNNPGLFLSSAAALVRAKGIMAIATMNRTIKSFLLAKVGAEYVLRWLPRGTHDWNKFQKPSELAAGLRSGGMSVREIKGMTYRPLADEWLMTSDLDVNYIMIAVKP